MATLELSDQKQKALDTALTQIERAHGKGSIMRMGADGALVQIESIATGALNLDAAIGQDWGFESVSHGTQMIANNSAQVLPGPLDHADTLADRIAAGFDLDKLVIEFQGLPSGLVSEVGRAQAKQALLQELIAVAETRYVSADLIAEVYFAVGDADRGFAAMQEAIAARSRGAIFIQTNPLFDDYREDARYKALVETVGF